MLKTVSSIVNAIGALNYKGTWNASTNTPTLTSGAGTKGDYYQVSVAGSTALDGISNWGVGDVAAFNGTTWQRIEGGADLNGVNLSVSGTSTLSGLTASTALALDSNKNIVSVTNTGSDSNVLATSPTIATPKITGDTIVAGDPSNADLGNQRFRNINIGSITAGGNSVVTVFPIYYRGFGTIDVNVVAWSSTDGSIMRAETQIFFSYSNNTLLNWGMKTPTYTCSLGAGDWRAGAQLTLTVGASSNNLTLTVTSTSGALQATRVMCQDFITTN
jgi:hypothetical protein